MRTALNDIAEMIGNDTVAATQALTSAIGLTCRSLQALAEGSDTLGLPPRAWRGRRGDEDGHRARQHGRGAQRAGNRAGFAAPASKKARHGAVLRRELPVQWPGSADEHHQPHASGGRARLIAVASGGCR